MNVVQPVRTSLSAGRRSVRTRSLKRTLIRRDLNPSESVVLCSDTRAGSTWLMELVGQLPGTVCNWEPMHPLRGVLPAHWDMGSRPYVPADRPDERLETWFDDLFRFRIANQWTLSRANAAAAAAATVGVHKFVRASLLLPWMVRHLPLERPPIFLVRHPLAAIASKNSNFGMLVPTTADRTPAVDDSHDPFAQIIAEQDDPVLVRVARWCHTNRVALNHPNAGRDWVVVHYEHLLLEPEETFRRVLDRLRWTTTDPDPVASIDFGRASSSDFLGALAPSPLEQLSKWRAGADSALVTQTQELLDRFGIVDYRADEVLPAV